VAQQRTKLEAPGVDRPLEALAVYCSRIIFQQLVEIGCEDERMKGFRTVPHSGEHLAPVEALRLYLSSDPVGNFGAEWEPSFVPQH